MREEEFEALLPSFEKAKCQRLTCNNRKRALRGGRHGVLKTAKEQLFFYSALSQSVPNI